MAVGRYAEARAQLDAVTNSMYTILKQRLESNLAQRENAATNKSAVEVSTNTLIPSTNAVNVSTNTIIAPTNSLPILTNGVRTLTNPPSFSPKTVSVLTNVPPILPNASNLTQP